jgi:hypothetical protein
MAYDTPVPPPRKPGFLGVFSPDRNATPVIVAAIGTVLLTTANAQPLAPRTSNPLDQVLVYGHQSLMSEAWQAVIVAVLVAASMLAVFRSWRHITVPAGLLVAVVGIGAVIANLLILNPALSVLDIMTTRIYWPAYAAEFVLPFFAAAATVLLAGRGARNSRLASGILLATGAFGYLNYLQLLDVFLTVRLTGAPGPGRAAFIGMLGSGVLLIGGVMARAENRAPRAGQAAQPDPGDPAPRPASVLFARLAAAAAVIAIAVSACYAYAFTSWPSGPVSVLLSVISSFLVYVAGPVVLAVAASLTVLGRRRPDRRFAAGVLVTGGVLTIMYFGYSNVFGWLIPLRGYDGWLLDSADIGVAGGLAMAVAGIALLLGRERGRLPDAPAADPQAAPSQDHGQDHGQDHDQGPRRWPAQPEMTRYLCTAPHLDDRYARRVVDEVVVDAHRAVVPSLGIDMAVVLAHCFAARRRQNIRDGLIAAIVIAALPVIFDYHRLTGLRIIVVLLALAGLVALAERWVSRYRVTAQLTRETFDRDDRPWITAAEHAQVAEALAAEQGDISVYGTYSPFVGSGVARGGWSFAINLARGKEPPGGQVRLEPLSFEVDEFYQEIARDLAAIGLADLTIENRLLVDGQHIRDDRRFLPDREGRPVAGLSADRLAQLTREPELHNRAYQCIRLQTWEGDLVLSVFVNFTKRGTALLAEVQHFLLAPLPPEYRQADRLASWPLGKRLRTELGSVPTAITGTVIRAPFRVSRLLLRAGLGWRARRAALRQIRTDPEYNFGAMTSVRELAQARHYRRYFQQVDRDLSTKLIDRQVLDTIVDFLDAHNVDTSQFQEQRSMILNNGLLVSGGEFTAGSVAVGEQARAGVTQFAQGVQSLLRQGGESQ